MRLKQKDIALLPFPFTDLQHSKVRPALVVSNDSINSASEDCVMVPLTSILKDSPYSVFITQDDMGSGKLILPSTVRADKIFTVEKSIAIMKIGALSDEAFGKVKSRLLKLFS